MDRRRALRMIAASGATAAAGSAIVSSPAFAYDAPVGPTGASISATTVGNERVNVDIGSYGTATCPMSANDTMVTGTFVRWEISKISTSSPTNALIQLRPDGGGGVIASLPSNHSGPTGFRLRKRNPAGTQDRINRPGDSYAVNLVVRYRCTYSDGTNRDLVRTWNFAITKGPDPATANNWSVALLNP